MNNKMPMTSTMTLRRWLRGGMYRVAKTHRMLHLHRSFSAKSSLISGSFAQRDLQLNASYASSPPCIMIFHKHLFRFVFIVPIEFEEIFSFKLEICTMFARKWCLVFEVRLFQLQRCMTSNWCMTSNSLHDIEFNLSMAACVSHWRTWRRFVTKFSHYNSKLFLVSAFLAIFPVATPCVSCIASAALPRGFVICWEPAIRDACRQTHPPRHSMIQWFNDLIIQWFNDSMIQWFNDSILSARASVTLI